MTGDGAVDGGATNPGGAAMAGDGAVDGGAAVIRLAVVDDHPVFRLGMTALLASTPGLEVVGEAADADEAVRVADLTRPEVIIMDLHLGGRSGVEATREIVARHPGTGVLVVTMLDDDDSVFAALRAGARGYLLKGAAPGEVERAVRAVANGEVLLGPVIASRAIGFLAGGRAGGPAPFPELTDREREVLDLVAQGLSNVVIARRLTLSPKTVRNHLSNVLGKLQVADRSQAIQRAREAGLGQP
ncbi:response regulator transcription factor [Micromonospora sp. NBC_01655]|uniref:response regulator transcription factor n=1 Tax=Micromonospora sp. NBC_01655 TaxID=2975983 RepID=UPI00224E94D3|nr:response regulator transcription factor [Micromonospora sp. NBC_01655]MCX4470731.1 response regulator transcription factor [Micromonospora sp. NBC_01655]